jgi:hypothetical protein
MKMKSKLEKEGIIVCDCFIWWLHKQDASQDPYIANNVEGFEYLIQELAK